MNKCERCRWHLYLDNNPCLLNPFVALYCEQHDHVFFEERIIEEDLIED